jgi:hypothetical protein
VTPVLVFDIETVPDVAGIRKLHAVAAEVSDADVAAMAFQLKRQKSGNDFLPLHLQRVVAISCALSDVESFRVWSLGAEDDAGTEAPIIQRFFEGIEKYTPQLVSWNGAGFDLPVLHYRGMIHAVRAPRYWDTGDDDREFRYNNYISRYHMRHCDVMDLLSLYQGRAVAPLDEIAQLLGLPGKLGMDGSQVWDAFQAGRMSLCLMKKGDELFCVWHTGACEGVPSLRPYRRHSRPHPLKKVSPRKAEVFLNGP